MDEQQIRAALLAILGTEALSKERFEALSEWIGDVWIEAQWDCPSAAVTDAERIAERLHG